MDAPDVERRSGCFRGRTTAWHFTNVTMSNNLHVGEALVTVPRVRALEMK